MIKAICDMCGLVMDGHGEETINLDFNAYEVTESKLQKMCNSEHDYEYNLCIKCAAKIHDLLTDMKERNKRERPMFEGQL